jgi:hypothetical protein
VGDGLKWEEKRGWPSTQNRRVFSIFFVSSASFVFFIAISSRHVLTLVTIKGGEYMVTSSDVNFTEKEKHSNFTGGA